MVVADFDVVCVAVHEPKTDSPPFIDRYRVLPFAIIFQVVQLIARRYFQIPENSCSVDLLKLSPSPGQNLRRQPPRLAFQVQFLGALVREGFDHPSSVMRHVTLVKK